MNVTVDIPDEFVANVVPDGRDAARVLLEESVAGAYREKRMTMEQVRRALGFGTRVQVDEFLLEHRIFDYTVEQLENDMAYLRTLKP